MSIPKNTLDEFQSDCLVDHTCKQVDYKMVLIIDHEWSITRQDLRIQSIFWSENVYSTEQKTNLAEAKFEFVRIKVW